MRSAILYANDVAREILSRPDFSVLRDNIVLLITEGKLRSIDVAERVKEDMNLNAGVSIATAASIVRRVARELIEVEVRQEVYGGHHAKVVMKHQADVSAARNKWMREQGMRVWTAEENAEYERIIQDPSMWRTKTRLNHMKVAAAMNLTFCTEEFTKELSLRHNEYLLSKRRKADAASKGV